jgi:hypothetical protein
LNSEFLEPFDNFIKILGFLVLLGSIPAFVMQHNVSPLGSQSLSHDVAKAST